MRKIYFGDVAPTLKIRNQCGNKGTFGRVCIIAGSPFMNGAAYFCAKAAYLSGCGIVEILTVPDNILPLKILIPEAILREYNPSDLSDSDFEKVYSDYINKFDAICIGPGLSREDYVYELVLMTIRHCHSRLIIDADAINCLFDKNIRLKDIVYNCEIALTPHPLELSRYLQTDIDILLKDYEDICYNAIHEDNAIIVAKGIAKRNDESGLDTVIFYEDKICYIQNGNAALATGGSGDILAGIITGFAASDMYSLQDCCVLGTYIHGLSGRYAQNELTDYCVTAKDILEYVPKAFKYLMTE